MNPNGMVFVALDGMGKKAACDLVGKFTSLSNPYVGVLAGFKIHDLWDQEGPKVLNDLECAGTGADLWVDLKLLDVPQTVQLRARAVRYANARFLTVHALGGIEMMKLAVESGPRIIAITILTSLSKEEVGVRFRRPAHEVVSELAWEAKQAGVWGVVCSAHEVGVLAGNSNLKGLKFIVPGIRLAGKDAIDQNQKRVNTPRAAFESGADYIVVGSELTKVEDPIAVLGKIVEGISEAVVNKGVSR
ncbi:MAG: orotidine-5'-phosphate decarboxylase [Parcubacteria group bacterium Gr01-1014_2]|nr:MAG: orotidine-5'-phosphate decarboxylase [Parcubacteria group bacterium Gr01-1014_2]